jgi:hypothetical protein
VQDLFDKIKKIKIFTRLLIIYILIILLFRKKTPIISLLSHYILCICCIPSFSGYPQSPERYQTQNSNPNSKLSQTSLKSHNPVSQPCSPNKYQRENANKKYCIHIEKQNYFYYTKYFVMWLFCSRGAMATLLGFNHYRTHCFSEV